MWAYPLYIFAVTPITGGVLRYMLLGLPLCLLVVGSPGDRASRWLVLRVAGACGIGFVSQWLWLQHSFVNPGGLMA